MNGLKKLRMARLSGAAPIALVCLMAGVLCSAAEPDAQPQRLRRADSFLGIHFDFHAGPDCTEVGKNTTPAMVENIINQVHPDYIQCDCKGHRGLSSYPTKVGNPAPGFVGDPLRVWRAATAARGVALFMHYSGVLDQEAVTKHPGWAAIGPEGKPNARATSVFSPYADQLLVPQLKELAGQYGVDGVWADGECWGTVPDYGPRAAALFKEKTGIADLPRKPADPHWLEWIQFHRAAFREYLAHYVAAVKKDYPDFQICSNWAFSDHMPEPVSVPVDFLSGDFSPNDSVNSARLAGRCLARQGKPWDLMAWSFARLVDGKPNKAGDPNQKTAVQLMREAAVVLALGGGFQAYFKQKRDGSIYDEQMAVMAEVAKFCRARQALCHRSVAVPQIALLYSTAAIDRLSPNVYSPRGKLGDLNGVLQALLESQYSVEVLSEHHLKGRMKDYPLIVIPDWEYLEPDFIKELRDYANRGGGLLLAGPKISALFPADRERGRIVALAASFGADYLKSPTAEKREILTRPIRTELFPKPLAEVQGSPCVDVTIARKDGRLLVNLVNTSGPHKTMPIIDSIAPVGPLQVTIRTPSAPAKVTLQPAGKTLDFKYAAGAIALTVPRVQIHEAIVVE